MADLDADRQSPISPEQSAREACDWVKGTADEMGFWEVPREALIPAQRAARGDSRWAYLAGNVRYALAKRDVKGATHVEYQHYVRSLDNISEVCGPLNGLTLLVGLDRGYPGYQDGPDRGGPPHRP